MVKKILCLMLAIFCVASMAVVGVSAADDTTIYFEVPGDWEGIGSVYCHIWAYGGDSLAAWQSKKEKCSKVEDGLYSYDVSKVGGLEDGTYYGVIFSADTGIQTYDTIMTSACYGDTLYSDGTIYENPQDSSKTAQAAFWKNQDAATYGPVKQITSIGNVIGTCCPPGVTNESLFTTFLTEWLESARTYSGKDDQAIIDDTAKALELSNDTVAQLIADAGVEVAWTPGEDVTPTEPTTTVAPTEPEVTPSAPADDEIKAGFALLENSNSLEGISEVKVGDTFEYALYVATPGFQNVEDFQGFVTYNSEYLEVVSAMSYATTGAVINTKEAGTVYFNATEVNTGMNLFNRSVITIEFKVLDAAEGVTIAEPAWTIEEMTEFNGGSIFTDSELVNDEAHAYIEMYVPTYEDEPQPTDPKPTGSPTPDPVTKPTAGKTDATSATDADKNDGNDTVATGATTAIFVALAVLALAGVAVVVLRKKANA